MEDSGLYQCAADNGIGFAQSTGRLEIEKGRFLGHVIIGNFTLQVDFYCKNYLSSLNGNSPVTITELYSFSMFLSSCS